TDDEKESQVLQVNTIHATNTEAAETALLELRQAALGGANIFNQLMETVKVCTIGQISQALNEVGGEYRRSM
ncbi:MAG: methylmalonyl-CoA mutase, partial [Planctomycetota bacterium]